MTYAEIVERFIEQRIAVVGDAILDTFYRATDRGESPEDRSGHDWMVERTDHFPGSSGVVARCVASLGGKGSVFTVTGAGDSAKMFSKALEAVGVDVAGVVRRLNRHTCRKERLVGPNGSYVAVTNLGTYTPIDRATARAVLAGVEDCPASVVTVTDNCRGVVTPELLRLLVAHCAEAGRKLIVDARKRPLEWYRDALGSGGAYLLTPNVAEAEEMTGMRFRTSSDIVAMGRRIRDELATNVLITMSQDGAYLFPVTDGMCLFRAVYPALGLPTEAVCVSGGGDTLVATVALGLAAGADLAQANEIAQVAAGISVRKPGTEVVTKDELVQALCALYPA